MLRKLDQDVGFSETKPRCPALGFRFPYNRKYLPAAGVIRAAIEPPAHVLPFGCDSLDHWHATGRANRINQWVFQFFIGWITPA